MSQDPDASNAKPPDADLSEDASARALAKEEASGVSDDGAKSENDASTPRAPGTDDWTIRRLSKSSNSFGLSVRIGPTT